MASIGKHGQFQSHVFLQNGRRLEIGYSNLRDVAYNGQ
ncbi:uncharacterized protein G2W53_001438 [Senna tora]|uniref:Uncharacterized protein n=1 Tax=Senna tora TaxID=362788 RepID=A0A834XH66_9FABA|nr:uncharacterized protein G2W53_001438 [Senna tora]